MVSIEHALAVIEADEFALRLIVDVWPQLHQIVPNRTLNPVSTRPMTVRVLRVAVFTLMEDVAGRKYHACVFEGKALRAVITEE